MKRSVALGAAAVMLVTLGACGSDDEGTSAGATTTTAAAAEEGVFTVNATEFAYSAPSSTPAGETTFKLVNKGEQMHMIALVKLSDGKTIDDVNEFLATDGLTKKPPSWAEEVKMKPVVAKPGEEAEGQPVDLEAGDYAMLCFIPNGKGGKPHALLGMTAGFTVE